MGDVLTPIYCPVCKKRQGVDVVAPATVRFRCHKCKRQFDALHIPLPDTLTPACTVLKHTTLPTAESVRLRQH